MTITNANYDNDRFIKVIREALVIREELKDAYVKAGGVIPENIHESAIWTGNTVEEFEAKNGSVGVLATENEDVRSLRELVIYGLKGVAAYTEHAYNLKYEDNAIYAFMQKSIIINSLNCSYKIKIF